jgi:hypothetical protein
MNRYIIEDDGEGFYYVLDTEKNNELYWETDCEQDAYNCCNEMNIDWNGG